MRIETAPSPPAHQLAAKLYGLVLAVTLVAGTGLFWPSLEQGLFADDYVAIAMIDKTFAAPRGPFDLFDFASGQASDVAALKRLGSIPWWAARDFRVSFMRPLSSALWHVDRALFGDWLVGYHLHSIAAWIMLVIAAAALYRTLLPIGLAALSLPMFALDHSLHFPVVWLSNRGGLYALALGTLGVLCHVRSREGAGQRAFACLSAALFAVALAFGEWAFPMLAYVLAYEVVEARGSLAARARALAPAALLGLAFMVLRSVLGYGATGSGAYVDPGSETGRFLLALIGRVPVFIADMLFNIPSSQWDHGSPWRETVLSLELIPPRVWAQLPEWRVFHAMIGAIACALLIVLTRVGLRPLPAAQRKRMAFLLLGAMLSLVPVVGSFPSTRLTMAAFLGVAPLFALTVMALARAAFMRATQALTRSTAARTIARAGLAYGMMVAIIALHLIGPLTATIGPMVDHQLTTSRWVQRAPLDPATVSAQHVYLLTGGEFTTTFFFSYIWAATGAPMPLSVQPLTAIPYAIDLTRSGPSSMTVHALGGSFLSSGQEHMFRSLALRTRVGQRFKMDGVSATVLLINGRGHPRVIELRFALPLDDPRMLFLAATPSGFARFPIPAVGETTRMPRAPGPSWQGLEYARELQAIGPFPEVVGYQPVTAALAFDPG